MTMTRKERCLAAIRGRQPDRIPVFPLLMYLAADRYNVSYRRFATDAAVLAEAQLNMRERFDIDAVTACSDAFRLAADLGSDMQYPEDHPPHSPPLVTDETGLRELERPDPTAPGTRMAQRCESVRRLAAACGDNTLVLGWIDLPFAEACSLCGVQQLMVMLALDPGLAHDVLEFLTPIVIDFALAQLDAGAPMIGAGDAAASMISPPMFREFAMPYERRVFEAIHEAGGLAKLHICGDTTGILDDMAGVGADLYNVDHMVDFDAACRAYGDRGLCFKGNLDPVHEMMEATPEQCERECFDRIRRAGNRPYMLSAGCEIPAAISDETFSAFCRAPQRRP